METEGRIQANPEEKQLLTGLENRGRKAGLWKWEVSLLNRPTPHDTIFFKKGVVVEFSV